MRKTYTVLGAGMQGTAAAYDLIMFGNAECVRLCDANVALAEEQAMRVNRLCGGCRVVPFEADVQNPYELRDVLEGSVACLSAVPYFFSPMLAEACIKAGVHFNDLGGNTDVVRKVLKLNEQAKDKNISLVPDCGVAPGMINVLAMMLINDYEDGVSIETCCGGLPQNRELPLGYKFLFSPEGLINEYFGVAEMIRCGELVKEPTFTDHVEFDWSDELLNMEMFLTSGGTSNLPEKLVGRVDDYTYHTIRYKGHYHAMKAFKDMGFFEKDTRHIFHEQAKKVWTFPKEKDMLLLSVSAMGTPKRSTPSIISLMDYQDDRTGFTAMERCTAFGATVITIMQANGQVTPGANTPAFAVDPIVYYEELKRRGFKFEETR